jgi:hypothetical protein
MGFDLVSHTDGSYFRWNLIDWPKVLELGRMFGWRPAGTIRYAEDGSPDPGWDGGYVTNDLQVVSAEDAAALADALERALDDIPDTPQIRTRTIAGMPVLDPEDAVTASPRSSSPSRGPRTTCAGSWTSAAGARSPSADDMESTSWEYTVTRGVRSGKEAWQCDTRTWRRSCSR